MLLIANSFSSWLVSASDDGSPILFAETGVVHSSRFGCGSTLLPDRSFFEK